MPKPAYQLRTCQTCMSRYYKVGRDLDELCDVCRGQRLDDEKKAQLNAEGVSLIVEHPSLQELDAELERYWGTP